MTDNTTHNKQPGDKIMCIEVGHTLPRNSIIAYHGGGYDGCIFEWNFVYIDKDGGFYELFKSGCLGITDPEELERREYQPFIKELERWRRDMANNEAYASGKPDRISVYDLSSENGLTDFTDSVSICSLDNCAEALSELGFQVKPLCDMCENRFNVELIHGGGGIHVEAGEIICDDCRVCNTCLYCGEFYDDDLEYRFSEEHKFHPESGYCKYCVELRNFT